MKNTHLSEEQIQAIVFDEKVITTTTLHAQQCESCSNRIKTYKLIFAQLETEPKPTFNFKITNPLMQTPKKIERKFPQVQLFVFTSVAFVLLAFGLLEYLSKFNKSESPFWLIIATATVLFIGLLVDVFISNEKKLKTLNNQVMQH